MSKDALIESLVMAVDWWNAECFRNKQARLMICDYKKSILLEYAGNDSSGLGLILDDGFAKGIAELKRFIAEVAASDFGNIAQQWWYASAAVTEREQQDREADFIASCRFFGFDSGNYISN